MSGAFRGDRAGIYTGFNWWGYLIFTNHSGRLCSEPREEPVLLSSWVESFCSLPVCETALLKKKGG